MLLCIYDTGCSVSVTAHLIRRQLLPCYSSCAYDFDAVAWFSVDVMLRHVVTPELENLDLEVQQNKEVA